MAAGGADSAMRDVHGHTALILLHPTPIAVTCTPAPPPWVVKHSTCRGQKEQERHTVGSTAEMGRQCSTG